MLPLLHHLPPRLAPGLRSVGSGIAVAVIMVTLAVVSIAPRSAEASCGDWLEGHQIATADQASDAVPSPSIPAGPCRGPRCGRAPSLPLAPSDAPVRLDVDSERALVAGRVEVPSLAVPGSWLVTDEPLSSPAIAGRLDRPPRQG